MAYYFGIKWYEFQEMPVERVATYMDCLEVIHSQEAMISIETSNFSSFKDSSRKKVLDKYEKIAFRFKQKQIITMDDMIGKLGHGG